MTSASVTKITPPPPFGVAGCHLGYISRRYFRLYLMSPLLAAVQSSSWLPLSLRTGCRSSSAVAVLQAGGVQQKAPSPPPAALYFPFQHPR